jgi:hypothetical protein
VKDWRDPSAYDFTETLDGNGWAWEFLRRNSEYQQDFEERCKDYDWSGISNHGPARVDFFVGPQVHDKEFSIDFPSDPGDPDFHVPDFNGSKRWGLLSYVNPLQDKPGHLSFHSPRRKVASTYASHPWA